MTTLPRVPSRESKPPSANQAQDRQAAVVSNATVLSLLLNSFAFVASTIHTLNQLLTHVNRSSWTSPMHCQYHPRLATRCANSFPVLAGCPIALLTDPSLQPHRQPCRWCFHGARWHCSLLPDRNVRKGAPETTRLH